MGLEEAFLRAILEAPDDDVPRLVYADWLDDHGDAVRAEFIRLQVRLARTPADAWVRAALVKREQGLIQAHGRRWAEPLRGLWWGWKFRRGFIEAVQFHTWYPEQIEALARVVNLLPLRSISTTDESPNWRDTVEMVGPALGRVEELRLECMSFRRTSEPVRALLSSPHVAGLKTLYIRGGRNWPWLSKQALRGIITSPSLAGLTGLTLVHDGHGLSGDLIVTLARTPRRARLEKLSLCCSTIEPDVMWELVSSPHLARLTELDLRRCGLPREAWLALLEAPHWKHLRRLCLRGAGVIDPEGARLADVGGPAPGAQPGRADEALREALVARFGSAVVDFSTEEPPHWEGHQWWDVK